MNLPGKGWGAPFMAGLLHPIIAVIIVISELISGVTGVSMNLLGYLLGIGYSSLL